MRPLGRRVCAGMIARLSPKRESHFGAAAICAQGRLGATIVRFAMPRKPTVRSLLFLSAISAFAPGRLAARPQYNSTYGPLPVFELHIGFWINLHHPLFHDARHPTPASP